MIAIELSFIQRLKLGDLLGAQEGSLAKTAPYLRVLEKVRFTDAEQSQISVRKLSPTMLEYAPPQDQPDFGKITAELENADGKALEDLMNSFGGFKTSDHVWADPILEALSQKK